MGTMKRVGHRVFVLFAVSAAAAGADQEYVGGHLRDVQPGAVLQRAEDAVAEEALLNAPVLPGDRAWTDSTGRLEIQLSTGSLVRLDVRSKLDLGQMDRDSATLHLWSGSAFVSHPGGSRVEVLVPGGRVEIAEPGRYLVDVYRGDVRVSVFDGDAWFDAAGTQVRVGTGERSVAAGGLAPDQPQAFDPWRETDEFVAYNEQRDAEITSAVSSREYLPEPVQTYAAEFDSSGSWYFDAEIGNVWRPNVVAGWRPYVDGRWVWTHYGWTWVPYESWGWATSHYGRWNWGSSLGWYWSPGLTWSGAWVSWAVGPTYVAWCPLGYRDRPISVPYGGHGRPRHAAPRGSQGGGGHGGGDGWSYVDRGEMGRRARPRVARPGDLEGEFVLAAGAGRLGRDLTVATSRAGERRNAGAAPRAGAVSRQPAAVSPSAFRGTSMAPRPFTVRQRRGAPETGGSVTPGDTRATSTTPARPPAAAPTRSRPAAAVRELLDPRQDRASTPFRPIRSPRSESSSRTAPRERQIERAPMARSTPRSAQPAASASVPAREQRATQPRRSGASRSTNREATRSRSGSSAPTRSPTVSPRSAPRPSSPRVSGSSARSAPRARERSEGSSRSGRKPPKK